jgi:hypothetical protein
MSLQLVLVVLLLVAICWSAMLHRRLAALRQGGDGIGKFVGDLIGATSRAEAATRQMREVSAELARQWQRQRTECETLAAELRRVGGDADALLREMRQPPVRTATRPDDREPHVSAPPPGPPGVAGAKACAADPSQHERIRHAIRDLR